MSDIPFARKRASFSTSPQAVFFACHNGISANPNYFQCDICPNFDCDLRIESYPSPDDFLSDLKEGMKIVNEVKVKPKSPSLSEKIKSILREFL